MTQEYTPYTQPMHFECCKRCIGPDECLGTRIQWLEGMLANHRCCECGKAKPNDGIPYCSLQCLKKEEERLKGCCNWCGGKLAVSRGEEGDDIGYYCPDRECSNSPMWVELDEEDNTTGEEP